MEIKKIKIAQCLLVLLWCIVQTAGAQKENKKLISGYVADSFTKEHLVNSKVELLLPDSTVLDSTKTYYYTYGKNPQSIFEFYVIKGGKYILRYSHRGYETNCVNIEATFYKRKDWFSVGTIYLKKKPKDSHQLNEVTVTATKIKFYMKGDTIIYNADAFQLSEGSMLDALIAQLPGVQLKEDGRIYINGKFVNSLLLNGKDFFRNDRKELLDNLPYYMVKSIKVYDKQSEFSKFIGRDTGDKELVMDVNLKPEYSIGWIANAETGIGSKDRYLGRFFALRFTPHSRLSAFGNMNNLNENRTPGRNGEWSPSNINNGLIASKVAGIDYNVENKEGNFTLNGNAKIEHSNSDNSTVTNSVNFLTGGDTYERSQSLSHGENTQISTNHSMIFTRGILYMTLSPSLSYRKYHSNSSSLSGSFSEDPANYISTGLLDSLSTLYA
ncbi:MAG: hypothetical protein KBH23_04865, partial [Bacteroidaceae bacterium]|nr:hypothetical protein [Bacteroidaceae bacterium]